VTRATVALSIVAVVVLGTIGFALFGVRRIKMDPSQYIVGGRSFGTLFLWVLMAGEIYTTFTFLGIAGLSYSQGAPAYYILAYGTAAYIIAYFLTPAIWRVGKEHGLLTGPDFFEVRYGSRALALGVAVLQFLMIVPYVSLQLSGLQILLRIAGYGMYDATVSVCIGFIVLALFVYGAGLRGTAWASVVKDVFVLGAVIFAGIAIPIRFFGSPTAMFDHVLAKHPQMLVLPPGGAFHGTVWYVSTVLLTSLGFFMGPQTFNAVFSARSEDTLRRNAMLLPFYQCFLILMLFAGFASALIVPGLKGTAVDQSFLLVVQHFYPSWVLGLIAAAGRARRPHSRVGAHPGRRERDYEERCRRHLRLRNRRRRAYAADARPRRRRCGAGASRMARRTEDRRRDAPALLQRHYAVLSRRRRNVSLATGNGVGCRRRNRHWSRGCDPARGSQRNALGYQSRLYWAHCECWCAGARLARLAAKIRDPRG
jgi:hypothetical protein